MKNKKMFKIVVLSLIALFSSMAGVYAERIIASNNVTYNNSSSGLSSTNVQGAIDELYSKYVKCAKSFGNFACFLQTLESSDTVIADDGTPDHNMRYTGKTPNNYVTLAGEEWRIIGTFNNVDNGSGTKEMRVKIIKSESIGSKKWHNSNVNIWKSASLNAELQASSYATNSMVDNAKWYLGDSGANAQINYITSQAYAYERGTKVASGNDLTWTGKVALMYPSDYGFASSACKDSSKTLFEYKDSTCIETNWLYTGSTEWLLSPYAGDINNARRIEASGYVTILNVTNSRVVRPVVYLKSSVICKNCNEASAGTKENPFIIV